LRFVGLCYDHRTSRERPFTANSGHQARSIQIVSRQWV